MLESYPNEPLQQTEGDGEKQESGGKFPQTGNELRRLQARVQRSGRHGQVPYEPGREGVSPA
jgi:hypothetical protein